LFESDTEIAVAAEAPPSNYVNRFGKPADIYSREINYWLWQVALDILKNRPNIGLVYVHTTDYAMHTWPPHQTESQEHLYRMDALIGEAYASAQDTAFFLTADHGMNYKKRCWDLVKVCQESGTPIRFALSPERDYYVKHHRNFTGCAYLWLKSNNDADKVTQIIQKLKGVEEVIPGKKAVERFHLVRERVGELVITGDRDTMFGKMETPHETLPSTYRAHGSLHEMDLPLIIYNYDGILPPSDTIQVNKDLTCFLYR
jgi:phosphonoacetate hydrolase